MKHFTMEDFSGAGQYLIRDRAKPGKYTDPGYMSTIMYKVGYVTNNDNIGNGEQLTCLTSMADGWTQFNHYITEDEEGNKLETKDWKKIYWQGTRDNPKLGKQVFVDYLNNLEGSQELRFATQEEVVRVVMYQSSRWKNRQ